MIACKYGGDEFIIILQGVDIQEFKTRLITFADEYMKLKKLADCPFSAGISEYVPGDFESSVATTDKLLYRAKSLGKSRMVCSDGTIIEI
jgi:PleD family two-component response regulator